MKNKSLQAKRLVQNSEQLNLSIVICWYWSRIIRSYWNLQLLRLIHSKYFLIYSESGFISKLYYLFTIFFIIFLFEFSFWGKFSGNDKTEIVAIFSFLWDFYVQNDSSNFIDSTKHTILYYLMVTQSVVSVIVILGKWI